MSASITNITQDKFNYWLLYYIFLGIIQAMWTNLNSFPPTVFRLAMTGAVFAPMILNKDLVTFGFPFFLILRSQLSTPYQYLPDSNSFIFYIPLLVFLAIIHWKSIQPINFKYYLPILLLIIYMCIIDIIGNAELGNYTQNLFVIFIFSLFLKNKHDMDILSSALITVCAISAIYYLIMYDQFLVTWNASEGIERSGWKDPNYFSTFMNVGILLALFYILRYIKSSIIILKKNILSILCLMIATAIILTASRAGFFCLAFILFITLFISKIKFKIKLIALCIIIFAIIIMYSMGVFDTLLYRIFEQGNINTGGERTTIWAKGIVNFRIQPYITQLFGGGYWHRTELTGGYETHNEFFAMLFDYGIIGFVLFMWLIISMFSFHRNRTSKIRNIGCVLYLLSIISLSPFQYVNIGFLILWILCEKKLGYQSYEITAVHCTFSK